jgi:hypothetical protein
MKMNYGTINKEDETAEPNENTQANDVTVVTETNLIIMGKNLNMTKSQLISVVILSLTFFLNWSYFSLFA